MCVGNKTMNQANRDLRKPAFLMEEGKDMNKFKKQENT